MTVDQMLEKLRATYGKVVGYDVLIQNIYGIVTVALYPLPQVHC